MAYWLIIHCECDSVFGCSWWETGSFLQRREGEVMAGLWSWAGISRQPAKQAGTQGGNTADGSAFVAKCLGERGAFTSVWGQKLGLWGHVLLRKSPDCTPPPPFPQHRFIFRSWCWCTLDLLGAVSFIWKCDFYIALNCANGISCLYFTPNKVVMLLTWQW